MSSASPTLPSIRYASTNRRPRSPCKGSFASLTTASAPLADMPGRMACVFPNHAGIALRLELHCPPGAAADDLLEHGGTPARQDPMPRSSVLIRPLNQPVPPAQAHAVEQQSVIERLAGP